MAKHISQASKATSKKLPQTPVKLSYLFLLIAYGFITVVTPNLSTLDSNGPKFLALALLNLFTFMFLFTRNDVKTNTGWYIAFFNTGIGIAYTGLMVVSLLSFFKAINVNESVLHFAKIFTAFSATYLVSVLIIADKRNILYLCVAMTLLLIFDSITIFSDINKYIQGKFSNINDIKSVYSNKNILASSVFVKIPFAIWLAVFNRKWLRTLGISGAFLAVTATFFLSTRSFYLGLFTLTSLLTIFFIYRYFQTREKDHLRLSGIFVAILVVSFLIFSATQRYIYPKTAEAKVRSVAARLVSITDNTGGGRLAGWERSWHVFRENPILGVGLGNWKIVTLEEENLTEQEFSYQIKAHNDFIEITTETGIFGGLLYIAIFLLTGLVFIRALFKNSFPEWMSFLFLPAFGLLCYSVDALFNFPQDRPEIQSLFALYVGMAVAFNYLYAGSISWKSLSQEVKTLPILNPFQSNFHSQSVSDHPGKSNQSTFHPLKIIFSSLLLTASVYILYLNFISLKLQLVVTDDIEDGILSRPASMFLIAFPAIPDLTMNAVPISVHKARYLINEQRNEEAIALLKKDRSNPFDVLSKGLIAEAYRNLNKPDSSIFYSMQFYYMKPNNFKNISFLCHEFIQQGRQKEGGVIIDKYLSNTKNNKDAWLYTSSFYEEVGNIDKATSIIDSASTYFPKDTLVLKQKTSLNRKAVLISNKALIDAASGAYKAKRYHDAARLYSELLVKAPVFSEARNYRAFCYYYMKEFAKSNQDLDILISGGDRRSSLYNMRGVNYYDLKNIEEACKNFKIAADMSDKEGISNYSKFCQPIIK